MNSKVTFFSAIRQTLISVIITSTIEKENSNSLYELPFNFLAI